MARAIGVGGRRISRKAGRGKRMGIRDISSRGIGRRSDRPDRISGIPERGAIGCNRTSPRCARIRLLRNKQRGFWVSCAMTTGTANGFCILRSTILLFVPRLGGIVERQRWLADEDELRLCARCARGCRAGSSAEDRATGLRTGRA